MDLSKNYCKYHIDFYSKNLIIKFKNVKEFFKQEDFEFFKKLKFTYVASNKASLNQLIIVRSNYDDDLLITFKLANQKQTLHQDLKTLNEVLGYFNTDLVFELKPKPGKPTVW